MTFVRVSNSKEKSPKSSCRAFQQGVQGEGLITMTRCQYETTGATLVEDDNLSSIVFSDPHPSAPVVQHPTQTQSPLMGQGR
ncbi:uncharacterized protein LOC141623804 isoform X2 [Silene latifolia]|uniref:uncharacterized protein LOC141623804 isoform X2 n=1 Tax=Silene latifolia TaxID=37657 RepID=UPI003D78382A